MLALLRLSAVACVLTAGGAAVAAQQLRAGVGRVEITPPIGSPMAGYSARTGVAEGVHDPLFAQALLLEQGQTRVALITVDLRRLASARLIDSVRALGYRHVIVHASHTHSGPDADRDDFPGNGSSWLRDSETAIVELVRATRSRQFDARLSVGTGQRHLCHNRRRIEADGSVTMLWRNDREVPTAPLDPTVGVLQLEDAGGSTRAVLVHYACHPVVLGPDNLQLSADYPGAMRRHLEAALGQRAIAFFLQGAAGDLNPYRDKQPVTEGAFEEMESVGRALAEEALVVLDRMRESSIASGPLEVRRAGLAFDHRWQDRAQVVLSLSSLAIGSDVALVFFPGEPFIEHQLTLRARSPFQTTLLLGYSMSAGHEWTGYIPTIEAAVQGGYGASYNTHIEPGAGEVMVDRAVIDLYRALGEIEAPAGDGER